MKHTKNILFAFLSSCMFAFAPFSLYGQYTIGKSISVKYGMSNSIRGNILKEKGFGINTTHALGIEKVLSRFLSFEAFAQYYQASYYYQSRTINHYRYYRILDGNYRALGGGAGFKFFKAKKGSLAPLGPWVKAALLFNPKTIIVDKTVNDDDTIDGSYRVTETEINEKSTSLDFRLSFGKTIHIDKGFMFDIGMEYNFPLSTFGYTEGKHDQADRQEFMGRNVYRNLVMVHFGIGYMLR